MRDIRLRGRAGRLVLSAVCPFILGAGSLRGQAEAPPSLPAESPLARVQKLAEERVLEVVIGPVKLPAGMPHLRLPIQMVTLPVVGWLHGFEWELRDASGHKLPDDLLHHVNLIDPDNRELFAPVPRRILAAGRETPRQVMPRLLGYPLEEGTRALIVSMFANPTETSFEEAYLHVRLFYSDRADGLFRPRNVFPFYMDVMGPVGAKSFPLPPGRTVRSWEGSPAISGRIMAVGGHLHDLGRWIRLIDVTEGKVIYEAEPLLNEAGRVVAVPTGLMWWKGGIHISRDHVYRFEVEYENPSDSLAPDGGMGALGGVILATGSDEWPELDRFDAAYIQDLTNTLEEPFRSMAHGPEAGMEMGGDEHEHGPASVPEEQRGNSR